MALQKKNTLKLKMIRIHALKVIVRGNTRQNKDK